VKDINPEAFLHSLRRRISFDDGSINIQARGYRNFSEIEGGYNAIATTVSKTDFVCQSKVLKV
jgi:hypothetical protein